MLATMVTIKQLGPLQSSDALIVVDVQQDFLLGGALAIKDGDLVIEPLNGYMRRFEEQGLPIFATRDWHPADHCSFRDRGGMWPAHCIAGTSGAAFSPQLMLPSGAHVISKGTQRDSEAYSGFECTDLASRLRECGCRRLFIGGLATDYCVQATARDALKAGFEVIVLGDAIRSVDAKPGDGARALAALIADGARVARLPQIFT